jgi:hypothetical protein
MLFHHHLGHISLSAGYVGLLLDVACHQTDNANGWHRVKYRVAKWKVIKRGSKRETNSTSTSNFTVGHHITQNSKEVNLSTFTPSSTKRERVGLASVKDRTSNFRKTTTTLWVSCLEISWI